MFCNKSGKGCIGECIGGPGKLDILGVRCAIPGVVTSCRIAREITWTLKH